MSDLKIADRMRDVHSDIRGPLFVEATRMEKEGKKILHLNTGNPATFGFKMPDSVRNALLSNVDRAVAYCNFKGMPEAREAICAYHQSKGIRGIDPDHIFIGNGVSEVAQMATTVLFEKGDEVLIPSPGYSLWTNLLRLSDATPVFYVCDEEAEWYPDLNDIRSKITPKTKAILLINPNNPTGAVYPREIVEKIAEIARENRLIVLSDEIYDRLLMDGYTHDSTAEVAPDLPVVTFNGLSKSHVICGFRCGWLCVSGPDDFSHPLIEAIQKLAAMRLCGNALTQLVIPAALNDPESTKAMLVPGGRLYEQREATCRTIEKIPGITFRKNHAAFYLFPRIDCDMYNIKNDKQFAMDVLHATNILFIPGSGFDWPKPDHFRLVMLPKADVIEESFGRMAKFMQTYRQK